MGANICVGHAEALSALWQGGGNALLGRLLGSHTSPALVTIGLMMLYNAVRGQPERLRNLVVKGAGDDEQEGGGGGGGGGAATGLWLPAALHLLAALHLVDARRMRSLAAAPTVWGTAMERVDMLQAAARRPLVARRSQAEATAAGHCSSSASSLPQECCSTSSSTRIGRRERGGDGRMANFPSGSALGLTYVAVLCDAIDSVCDDEGDACAGMERGAGITIAQEADNSSRPARWTVVGGSTAGMR